MNATVQSLIVVVIVTVSASYAALKFMPAAWRKVLATSVASLASRSGLSTVQARRVEAKLASGGACGSCDSCRACAPPARDEVVVPTQSYRRIPIRRASS